MLRENTVLVLSGRADVGADGDSVSMMGDNNNVKIDLMNCDFHGYDFYSVINS